MSIQTNYDVVVIGSGPVGITLACLLQAFHQTARICVLDKRADTTRNHGLHIESDSVAKIQEILEKNLNSNDPFIDKKAIKELSLIFKNWSSEVVRTNTIEMTLTEKAKTLGIDVLRGKDYAVTDASFDLLESAEPLTDQQKKVQHCLQSAKVIIGADGSHSVVRKKVMGDNLVDKEILQHLAELKFQTNGDTPKRSYLKASAQASLAAAVAFETLGKPKKNSDMKPVTLHLIIDEKTFQKLIKKDEHGTISKGDFKHPWTMQEISEAAKADKCIKKVFEKMDSYLADIYSRGGRCENEKVTCIPMQVYRSSDTVRKYKKKIVALAGDANSGIVFERGFNKGLQEAILCAHATSKFLKRSLKEETVLPPEFEEYQHDTRGLFQKEVSSARLKNYAIHSAQYALETSITPFVQRLLKITSYIASFFKPFSLKSFK